MSFVFKFQIFVCFCNLLTVEYEVHDFDRGGHVPSEFQK